MSKWEDQTPYSRGQRGNIDPTNWMLRIGDIRLYVTRMSATSSWRAQAFGPLDLSFPLECDLLGSVISGESAKREAVLGLVGQVRALLDHVTEAAAEHGTR